jgi:glucose repression regulatory protein TUP1
MTPDADWVMSGSKDRGVQFWNPRTGDTQLMLQGHKNSGEKFSREPPKTSYLLNTIHAPVISVAPSPQGEKFATGSGDMRARIWK